MPSYRARAGSASTQTRAGRRLTRLRMYSYGMTLSACVLALLAFTYLLSGAADGDAVFVGIGIGFVVLTVAALWAAMRVTRAGHDRALGGRCESGCCWAAIDSTGTRGGR